MHFYGIVNGDKKLIISGVSEGYRTPTLEDFFEDIDELEICSIERSTKNINPCLKEMKFPETASHLVWFKTQWLANYLYKSININTTTNILLALINRKLVRIKIN